LFFASLSFSIIKNSVWVGRQHKTFAPGATKPHATTESRLSFPL